MSQARRWLFDRPGRFALMRLTGIGVEVDVGHVERAPTGRIWHGYAAGRAVDLGPGWEPRMRAVERAVREGGARP